MATLKRDEAFRRTYVPVPAGTISPFTGKPVGRGALYVNMHDKSDVITRRQEVQLRTGLQPEQIAKRNLETAQKFTNTLNKEGATRKDGSQVQLKDVLKGELSGQYRKNLAELKAASRDDKHPKSGGRLDRILKKLGLKDKDDMSDPGDTPTLA